ncbi:MAG TPA: hypothetical protein VF219_17645 [Vicinamibacterales bacterium]
MPGGGKGGGSTTSTVNVNNGPINVDSDSTVEVKGLDNIKVDATVHTPDTLKSDATMHTPDTFKSDITTHSDIKSDSDSNSALSVDLKPVVLDVCSTSSTKLPHGEISQPFHVHFGLTWFGTEFFGFNLGGESRMILQDLPKKPAIEWPAQQNAVPQTSSTGGCSDDDDSPLHARGLRVRIK